MKEVKDSKKIERSDKRKNAIIGLSIALGVMSATTLGLGIAYGMSENRLSRDETQLENVYQKNLYDLVESVNNTETKLSKVLASNDSDYQNKTLVEVSHNAELAQQSITSLPISDGSISDTISFINQVGGYTTTLAKKLSKGGRLTSNELKTLADIRSMITSMKLELNDFVARSQNESIIDQSLTLVGDENQFTIQISKMKDESLDYPTMIYDGPFSDSETNIDVKGLKGEVFSEEEAFQSVAESFKDISSHKYEGEINSKIETYNFKIQTTTNHTLYAQVSKIGGHIITVSGTNDNASMSNFDMGSAEKLAVEFAKENGIENPKCVWKDELESEGYFNIAPTQKGIILYPDLVKVKIDLSTGVVIGYDASTYFTNHTNRLLGNASLSESAARQTLPDGYNISEGRLVLAPLEYSREVLCYEFKGEKDGATYYFYVNAETGKEENILKVIETSDGSKLM